MKKHLLFIPLFLFLAIQAMAQGPNNSGEYYHSADGKMGSALKTALAGIINTHKTLSYDFLWTAFETTDVRPDGRVWDMYSCITNYRFGHDQGGSYSKEGDLYNREHSFPKSWFNDASPMVSDLMHIVPTDGKVNGMRSNHPFGETNGGTYTSANGFSKVGSCIYPGYSGTVFEPNDEYKGDFARIYFYMVTCYESKLKSWSSDMLNNSTYPAFSGWAKEMLLKWAKNDPVSQKEIDRNNGVYGLQENRNPFVDYPGLEQYIWGDAQDWAFYYDDYEDPFAGGGTGGGDDSGDGDDTGGDTGGGDDVNPGELPTGVATYTKVTSADELTTGTYYLIVCDSKSVAMAEQDASIRSYSPVTITDNAISTAVSTTGKPYALKLGGTPGAYTFYDETDSKYLALTASKNEMHETDEALSNESQWTINISGGVTTIANNSRTRSIQYNASAPRFACYSSAQTAVSLYKLQATTDVNHSLANPMAKTLRAFNLQGVCVGQGQNIVDILQTLPKGIYIVGKKKYIVH